MCFREVGLGPFSALPNPSRKRLFVIRPKGNQMNKANFFNAIGATARACMDAKRHKADIHEVIERMFKKYGIPDPAQIGSIRQAVIVAQKENPSGPDILEIMWAAEEAWDMACEFKKEWKK